MGPWRSQAARDVAGVFVASVVLLALCAGVTGVRRIHGYVQNDAVGYTTAARSLAQSGHLTGHVIYPSVLGQHTTKGLLYMPGFYAALACSYKIFGYGAWQSLLVNWAAYVTAACCTYLLGRRLYGRWVGFVAAGLFLIWPANLYFSMTAMSEMAVTAAGAVAITAAAWMAPRRRLLWAGPLLLVIPFLFRETTAFLVLPLMALAAQPATGERGRGPLRRAAAVAGLSVVVLTAAFLSPASAGRPSLLKLDVFIGFKNRGRAVYTDAVPDRQLHPTATDWARAALARGRDHLWLLGYRLQREGFPFELAALVPILLAVPLLLLHAAARRDVFTFATALMLLCTGVFLCALYTVRADKPLRLSMFAAPLVAVGLAAGWADLRRALMSRFKWDRRPWMTQLPAAAIALVVLLWCGRSTHAALRRMAAQDGAEDNATRLVESWNHDDRTVLAGPSEVCLPYVERHFPVTFSFVPANAQTLRLLCSHATVGSIAVDWRGEPTALRPADLEAEGFRLHYRASYQGKQLDVYQRPGNPEEAETWLKANASAGDAPATPEPARSPASRPAARRSGRAGRR